MTYTKQGPFNNDAAPPLNGSHMTAIDNGVFDLDTTLAALIAGNASESTKGIAQVASQSETDAGLSDSKVVTPLKIAARPQKNAVFETFITGLNLSWNSGTSITVKAGAAWVPSVTKIVNVPADITLTSGVDFTLGANKWYYVYLTDTGTVSVVRDDGINPTPVGYKGMAKQQTSNTARRYLGALRSNAAATAIYKFRDDLTTRYWMEAISATGFRVLTSGAATTSTSVPCVTVVPVSSRVALTSLTNIATDASNNYLFVGYADLNGTLTIGNYSFAVYPNTSRGANIELSSTQTFNYVLSTSAGSPAFCDILGYIEER